MFYLQIFIAGGLGVLLRFLVTHLTRNAQFEFLPVGVLSVNVIGSFLIGFLAQAFLQKWSVSPENQVILTSGFLGGFTTFSAFSLESINMAEQHDLWRALIYVLLHLLLCITACLLGLYLAKQ